MYGVGQNPCLPATHPQPHPPTEAKPSAQGHQHHSHPQQGALPPDLSLRENARPPEQNKYHQNWTYHTSNPSYHRTSTQYIYTQNKGIKT